MLGQYDPVISVVCPSHYTGTDTLLRVPGCGDGCIGSRTGEYSCTSVCVFVPRSSSDSLPQYYTEHPYLLRLQCFVGNLPVYTSRYAWNAFPSGASRYTMLLLLLLVLEEKMHTSAVACYVGLCVGDRQASCRHNCPPSCLHNILFAPLDINWETPSSSQAAPAHLPMLLKELLPSASHSTAWPIVFIGTAASQLSFVPSCFPCLLLSSDATLDFSVRDSAMKTHTRIHVCLLNHVLPSWLVNDVLYCAAEDLCGFRLGFGSAGNQGWAANSPGGQGTSKAFCVLLRLWPAAAQV